MQHRLWYSLECTNVLPSRSLLTHDHELFTTLHYLSRLESQGQQCIVRKVLSMQTVSVPNHQTCSLHYENGWSF
jgi:hypothetical protein